jgi:chromosome segregation protein
MERRNRVHIKRIELLGFRSYPDRTEISCERGVQVLHDNETFDLFTAIRYALMESRLRVLNCRRLEDLIFAGDGKRRAMNISEVSLEFDNADRTFPLDWHSVEIQRRYFRIGESEFFLNRVPCRLKDISELLQDVLNVESAAVWGNYERLMFVDLSPESRRRLWDITAGHLVNRKRTAEFSSKQQKTQRNLDRVNVIVSELSQQMEQLKNGADPENNQTRIEERLNFLKGQQCTLSRAC